MPPRRNNPLAFPAPRAALCLLLTLFVLSAFLLPLHAHVPVPDSVLDPRSASEAWNVLRLTTANVDRLLAENRLSEVNDQLSLCGPALRALPRYTDPVHRTPVAEQAIRGSVAVGSMAQAAVAGDRPTADAAFAALRTALDAMSASFDPATVHADIYTCPMHPDFVSADRAALCAKCGMALAPRRIPYSFVYVPPGEPTLQLTATPDHPLAAGKPVTVTVHLRRRDGTPVLLPDLTVVHTQPIHLLIVDPALEDYHHEHPVPAAAPGDYVFTFTPARESSYRIFADVVPVTTGVQEYPFTDLSDLAAPAVPPAFRQNTLVSTVGSLTFCLAVPDAVPHAQTPCNLRLEIEGSDHQPLTRLEPVMAAFAHLVGFYEDGHTVVHLHPAGGEITNPAQRGGPALDFRFYPPKPGFLRLFVQIQLDGHPVFAPFDLHVEP